MNALEEARYELESQGIVGIVVPPLVDGQGRPPLQAMYELYQQWTEGAARRLAKAKSFPLFSPAHMIYSAEAQVLAACAEELRKICVMAEWGHE